MSPKLCVSSNGSYGIVFHVVALFNWRSSGEFGICGGAVSRIASKLFNVFVGFFLSPRALIISYSLLSPGSIKVIPSTHPYK
jgi:hypothetical protein